MVKILDCTTRDGGYCTNWNYSDGYIYNLMSVLNSCDVSFFEIGYRNYYENSDKGIFYHLTPALIKKFYEKRGQLKLGVMVDTKRYSESDFADGTSDYIDFLRIATHPDKIYETLKIAEMLHKRRYSVMIQLMDISNLTEEHYKILAEWGKKHILQTIYLADTYGIITPNDVEKIYNILKDIGYENISFHAHNKTHQALANTLKSIELGAYSVDVTQDGEGINGGNLSYNELEKFINPITSKI